MLDAPVTGNPKVASEGKLGIMVGGPPETFEACLPVFQAMGVKIIHVGENGKGTTLKLINNLIMGVAIEAVAEALVLASKAGIDPNKVVEITSVGGARTGAMEVRGPRMVKHDFSPIFPPTTCTRIFPARLNWPTRWASPCQRPASPGKFFGRQNRRERAPMIPARSSALSRSWRIRPLYPHRIYSVRHKQGNTRLCRRCPISVSIRQV